MTIKFFTVTFSLGVCIVASVAFATSFFSKHEKKEPNIFQKQPSENTLTAWLPTEIPPASNELPAVAGQTGHRFTPPPTRPADRTDIPVKRKGKKVPSEWIEQIHRAAPGHDWKTIEAQSLQQLGTLANSRNLNGTWMERGPSNVPGRITDVDIDYTQNRIYALSDHGLVFRSDDLNGSNWISLNDHFPLGLDVSASIKVLPGVPERVVVAGYLKAINDWGVYYSDNAGVSWQASTGFEDIPLMGIKRMQFQGDTAYLFVHEYNPQTPVDYYTVYRSVSRASDFEILYRSTIPVGDGGRHGKSDMWVSNDLGNSFLYLSLEDSLFLVDKYTGNRTFNSTITGNPELIIGLLTGLTTNGVTELRAYAAVPDSGTFYAWNSNEEVWKHQGSLYDWWLSGPFGQNSFSCSQVSADTMYFGSILTSRSTNGGVNWTIPDLDPTQSFALYHGDVPKTLNIINTNTGEEETYMGTDGGLYRRDPATDHFEQLSIPGLNCTQIYKMVSSRANPGKMFIGTQDNGYATTLLGEQQTGAVDFTTVWGGDVTNMASGDDGQSFWVWWWGDGCNYVTSPDDNGVSSTWSPFWQNGSIPYWEAPIWVSTHQPDRCFSAGTLNGGTGSHLLSIQAMPGADAVGTEYPFDFHAVGGGRITAIAQSPINSQYFYVTTDNGYFFTSTDGGLNWESHNTAPYFYARCIYPSRINLGEVWVGGSGYSNAPVFHTINNGGSMEVFDAGMPSCLVEALAANDDETILFAATSIAPFAFETSEGTWALLAGIAAPLVHYMDVEYLPEIKTARFATYARGVWDWSQSPSTKAADQQAQNKAFRVFPNPATDDGCTLYCDPADVGKQYVLVNASGQFVAGGTLVGQLTTINLRNLVHGTYYIVLDGKRTDTVVLIKQ